MDRLMRACGWGLSVALGAVCFYAGLYGVVRSQDVVKRHMIGNAEAQHYWVSGDLTTETGRVSSLIFKPLTTLEGEVTTYFLSEEYVLLGDEL